MPDKALYPRLQPSARLNSTGRFADCVLIHPSAPVRGKTAPAIEGGKRDCRGASATRKSRILRNHGLLTVGRPVEGNSIGWSVMAGGGVAEVHVKAPNGRPDL